MGRVGRGRCEDLRYTDSRVDEQARFRNRCRRPIGAISLLLASPQRRDFERVDVQVSVRVSVRISIRVIG